ncbi:MAG: hypothetical protein HPY50_14040 [Firmicutes bacterium]|nr:hypothetical protein [Bacillota bacterium]
MRKKIKILILSILTLIVIANAYSMFFQCDTPEKAIRRYVLLKGNPIEACYLNIKQGDYIDERYGIQFGVEGYYDNLTEMQVMFFYLRQDARGCWHVTSAGTGP